MKEWADKNKYNSFNSTKGLMFVKEYEGFVEGKFLPPIETLIAPNGICNSNCIFCNSKKVLEEHHNEELDFKLLKKLIPQWIKWGVKGFCFSGDGEPTLYKGLKDLLLLVKKLGGVSSIISNGMYISDELKKVISDNCQWIGFSVDAATPKTYAHMKGVKEEIFTKTIKNIKDIVNLGGPTQVSMKFLIHPDNCHEIYQACLLAKKIGVYDFHVRPVCTEGFYKVEHKEFTDGQLTDIDFQLIKCFAEENENFRVYGCRHKFSPDLQVANNFEKCWAAPLILVTSPDGYAYFCIEMRGNPKYRLCKIEDIQKYWGSKEHVKLLRQVQPKKECKSRCTMCAYNEQVENCIIKDKMCRRFP